MGLSISEARELIEEMLAGLEDVEEYEELDDGRYRFIYASTELYLEAYQDQDTRLRMLNFSAVLARDFRVENISQETALQLLAFNRMIPLGSVSLSADDGVIWFEYSVPLELVGDRETVAALAGIVANVADAIDEDIAGLVGGRVGAEL